MTSGNDTYRPIWHAGYQEALDEGPDKGPRRCAVISANLGAYDDMVSWPKLVAPPGWAVDVHRLDDTNIPPRPLAMTSRLQCGIPKWCGVDFCALDTDAIIWVDASCAPTKILVPWFLERLGDGDIAVFAHPERRTIREEYEFVTRRMARPGETYLNSRYKDEWIDAQFECIRDHGGADLPLYASTAFAYTTSERVVRALVEVLLHKCRFLLHDQLAFSYVLDKHGLNVRVIPDNYLKCPALTFMRKQPRR